MTLSKGIHKVKRIGSHNSRPVIFDGKDYDSLAELSRELKISRQLLFYYLSNDKPILNNYIDYK